MKHEKFNSIVTTEIDKIKVNLVDKGHEYCFSDDRLDCFKKAASFLHCNNSNAVLSFLTKHIVSMVDMVQSGKVFSRKQWEDKLNDIISYCLIMHTTVDEDGLVGTPEDPLEKDKAPKQRLLEQSKAEVK